MTIPSNEFDTNGEFEISLPPFPRGARYRVRLLTEPTISYLGSVSAWRCYRYQP